VGREAIIVRVHLNNQRKSDFEELSRYLGKGVAWRRFCSLAHQLISFASFLSEQKISHLNAKQFIAKTE
jgi:hypothetical protein